MLRDSCPAIGIDPSMILMLTKYSLSHKHSSGILKAYLADIDLIVPEFIIDCIFEFDLNVIVNHILIVRCVAYVGMLSFAMICKIGTHSSKCVTP